MKITHCFWNIENKFGSWPHHDAPPTGLVPALLRRRLTFLGKQALELLYAGLEETANEAMPWIVASRHGDNQRKVRLLTALAKQ